MTIPLFKDYRLFELDDAHYIAWPFSVINNEARVCLKRRQIPDDSDGSLGIARELPCNCGTGATRQVTRP